MTSYFINTHGMDLQVAFPQLRHLELRQLPKLVSILNTQKSVINDAGEIIPECELDFHTPILQEQVY